MNRIFDRMNTYSKKNLLDIILTINNIRTNQSLEEYPENLDIIDKGLEALSHKVLKELIGVFQNGAPS